MTIIEYMRQKLTEYPKISEFLTGDDIHIDFTEPDPVNYGLSSNGDSLVKEDILGNQIRTLNVIAERQDISEKYLESILKVLVQDKLLTGLRGRGGGYRLTKAPEDYTLGEILRLTEGSLAPVACTDDGEHDCPRKGICPSHPVWQKLDNMINEFFDGITLADLIQTAPQ